MSSLCLMLIKSSWLNSGLELAFLTSRSFVSANLSLLLLLGLCSAHFYSILSPFPFPVLSGTSI